MYQTVAWPLRRAAQIRPDGEAIVDGPVRRTWAEVHDRLARLASGLDRLYIAPGDRVAVLAHNSGNHLEAWLGLPAHGRVINDLNLRLAAPELAFMIDDCECVALLADDDHFEMARGLMEQCPSLRELVYIGSQPQAPDDAIAWDELLKGEAAPFPAFDENTLAAIVYTGGTSGNPKGVMLSHRNLLSNAKQFTIACGHVPSDRYLHAAPMFHVADMSQTFAMTWAAGTHVIVPGFNAGAVADTIESERITLTLLVPTMIGMLLDHIEGQQRDLSSLRLLMYAGSPMPKETQRRAMTMLDCDFTQMYGMTEAAPLVTQATAEDHRRGAAGRSPTSSGWTPRAPRWSACSARCATRSPASRSPSGNRVRSGSAARTSCSVTGVARRTRLRRSRRTAGTAQATWPTWTTAATSTSSTASRT